jgi:hypothetical protein
MHPLSNTQGLLSQRQRQCLVLGQIRKPIRWAVMAGNPKRRTVKKPWANASP